MKIWQETTQLYNEMSRLLAQGQSCALATLIRIEGSSYRRPGAKLLIRSDGSMAGNVSGGCLEEDLRERARQTIHTGQPELIHYNTGEDENVVWGLGLGCKGQIDIWLERFEPNQLKLVNNVRTQLHGNEAFVLCTTLDTTQPQPPSISMSRDGDNAQCLASNKSRLIENVAKKIFVDAMVPPPDAVIFGAGDDAIPLVHLVETAGFRVTVIDHRSAYLNKSFFPETARLITARPEDIAATIPAHEQVFAVIKTHSLKFDKAWTHFIVKTPATYIGLLGPQARRKEIVESLPADQRQRVYGPIGLDIGAEGSEQVAVSIVAEMLAVYAHRTGGHLQQRKNAIH